MSKIDNILIQVRARLHQENIKLWLEPYYYDEIGSNETEMHRLAESFSNNLGISMSYCRMALNELQDGALRKLASRKEFTETGIATLTVRRVSNQKGTENIVEFKCSLKSLGSELQKLIADKFELNDPNRVKCISAGKIVQPDTTLEWQGFKNNQQIMAIISDVDNDNSSKEEMYDRIRKIKQDVEAVVDCERQLVEMEDQDGNAIFMPPSENRALLMALGFYEKARVAIKREHYDEALILLLEADEKFKSCNSRFLETVDNYALVNLDIVWCYLRLKNISQLPDAENRLKLCEESFNRSYGKNLERLIALRGEACAERVLILRLHLLQGVILFHQNQRDAAYEKLELATNELRVLKVDDETLATLVEMGYQPYEARLALRSTNGNLDRAVNFIYERRDKLEESRKRSVKERRLNHNLTMNKVNRDKDWVNPRSICTLMDMGYSSSLSVAALKRTKNDIPRALDLLQNHSEELRQNLPSPQNVDNKLLEQLIQLGFQEKEARIALQSTRNSIEKSIDMLVKMFETEEELKQSMKRVSEESAPSTSSQSNQQLPSTSTGRSGLAEKVKQIIEKELESLKAYQRFHEDLPDNEQDYLDLPLAHEEHIIAEYKNLLEQ